MLNKNTIKCKKKCGKNSIKKRKEKNNLECAQKKIEVVKAKRHGFSLNA